MPNRKGFKSHEEYLKWYRKYQKTKKIREYRRDYIRKWRKKTGDSKNAIRKKLMRAVKSNLIEKLPCAVCGFSLKVEAHHRDYRSPLKVVWLCRRHHREADIRDGKRKS